ncbi:hypothetical protein [Mesobacillus foraminis]|uniref:hypothetical protein n=1 Tax=Mesobacillus foraminis TaxID=279826 RepID=UPI0010524333|nr:hypothetical protein [Mesobacillus foraminis]
MKPYKFRTACFWEKFDKFEVSTSELIVRIECKELVISFRKDFEHFTWNCIFQNAASTPLTINRSWWNWWFWFMIMTMIMTIMMTTEKETFKQTSMFPVAAIKNQISKPTAFIIVMRLFMVMVFMIMVFMIMVFFTT